MTKRLGGQSYKISSPVSFRSTAAVVGRREGEGPLKHCFDRISEDSYFGEETWEKAETRMLADCFSLACDKAKLSPADIDLALAGDLLNQCVSSAFAMKDTAIPYLGLYGACSTIVEAAALGAMLIDGGGADTVCAMTGSHFCAAERQYRFPLEYGGQRTPSSQWTATGAGAAILTNGGDAPYIRTVTVGRIVDAGITDANSMGAAMAPAACDTLCAHFRDTGRRPEDYDAIFTGDLGAVGHDILQELMRREDYELDARYMDCGVLLFDLSTQDVHAGGSGCGCCASVLCGHVVPAMKRGVWRRVLVAATGALMSPLSCQQGGTIPGICHAISLDAEAAE